MSVREKDDPDLFARIQERNRKPYYAALKAADVAWEAGQFDVSELTTYLGGLLTQQLSDS
jgi:hypothetical protein